MKPTYSELTARSFLLVLICENILVAFFTFFFITMRMETVTNPGPMDFVYFAPEAVILLCTAIAIVEFRKMKRRKILHLCFGLPLLILLVCFYSGQPW